MKTFDGASGVQYEIGGHGYRAVITEVGACLRELDYDGRALIVSFGVDEPMVAFRGALAAPWPNRLADGRYTADGHSYQLPINEPSRNCALHGLVFDSSWHLLMHTPSTLVLGLCRPGDEGYPFQLDLMARYEVTAGGLTTRIEARNTGSGTAPYGVCPHPYLRAGDSPLDSWTLTLPADRYLRVSPDRMLPVALDDVAGGAFDYRSPREIGPTQIDHAFTGLARNDQSLAVVEVRESESSGVSMSFDAACPWLQIHTADLPDPERTRIGLAVEPMTCPPDSFNSQTDLIRLGPGEVHQASWTIMAL